MLPLQQGSAQVIVIVKTVVALCQLIFKGAVSFSRMLWIWIYPGKTAFFILNRATVPDKFHLSCLWLCYMNQMFRSIWFLHHLILAFLLSASGLSTEHMLPKPLIRTQDYHLSQSTLNFDIKEFVKAFCHMLIPSFFKCRFGSTIANWKSWTFSQGIKKKQIGFNPLFGLNARTLKLNLIPSFFWLRYYRLKYVSLLKCADKILFNFHRARLQSRHRMQKPNT